MLESLLIRNSDYENITTNEGLLPHIKELMKLYLLRNINHWPKQEKEKFKLKNGAGIKKNFSFSAIKVNYQQSRK